MKELLAAVRTLCEAFGIEVDARRDHQFASLKVDQLTQLVDHLKTERKWPDEG